MNIITHKTFEAFLDDLHERKHVQKHDTQCKDSPKRRLIGFLDLTTKEWITVGLSALQNWEHTEKQQPIREALKTAAGRHSLMGEATMREETFQGQTIIVPEEPEWVDAW